MHYWVAGVDEVGRGPLAGAVVAAAVILDPQQPIEGLVDSKKISEKKREQLSKEIKLKSLAWCIAHADVNEIDELNILQASLLAMTRAVAGLTIQPHKVLADGNKKPNVSCACEAIVKGDQTIPAISAASIIAKVARDHEMIALDGKYPGYGFAKHKGYPTREHLKALSRLGVTEIHRRSFGPVKTLIDGSP